MVYKKKRFFFKKPCITLRDETEWVELVSGGFNVLVGASEKAIKNAYYNAEFTTNFECNLYGGGTASTRIVTELLNAS